MIILHKFNLWFRIYCKISYSGVISNPISGPGRLTRSISAKKPLLYSTYDGVAHRAPINNVEIESVGSAGQAGSSYEALV